MDSPHQTTASLTKVFASPFLSLNEPILKLISNALRYGRMSTANICRNGTCENTMASYKSRFEERYLVKPDQDPGFTDLHEFIFGTFNSDTNSTGNGTV